MSRERRYVLIAIALLLANALLALARPDAASASYCYTTWCDCREDVSGNPVCTDVDIPTDEECVMGQNCGM